MKWTQSIVGAVLCLNVITANQTAAAENAPAKEANAKTGTLSEREQRFQENMTKVVLEGRWNLVRDGALTPEREDRYTIESVQKREGDVWAVYARVQYGDKNVVAPIPVHVHWAGDTPVLSLTDLNIPGLGTYTARVVIHDNQYAGVWSGGDHTGHLHGVIEKQSKEN